MIAWTGGFPYVCQVGALMYYFLEALVSKDNDFCCSYCVCVLILWLTHCMIERPKINSQLMIPGPAFIAQCR